MSTRNPREKAVFVGALANTDPEQRRQFLDQACGADQALRDQVEKLLALSQSAGDFFNDCAPALEPAAAAAAQVLSAAESAQEPEFSETKCIGPYKLLQKLGEGGCGVVYMAEQEQPIRRRVALKIIKLGMDTRNVIARFEAERQALALMDHPNIARVLDAGATDTGRPYFVMELVYGVKITDYCDQNRVSMRERLQLFIQVCNAVQHAHQKGIIHRDLKPSNIMVTMNDGVPAPKVIDFGIAKATEQRLTDKTLFTSYAQLMGTPAYMSPEQMEFSGLNLDTRSDIYSLGILLYELLTGRTPFDTADLLKLGVDELRRTVCEQEPLSPSAKLQTLNNEEMTKTAKRRHIEPPRLLSQLRGDLDWIVLKCLEKDRTRRYATANGLAMDIERYLHEETVLARPPSQLYRLQKLVRRNRMVFLSGAAAAAALLLGTIISTMMFVKEREARSAEARLRREAELREQASHVASLVTQGRFDEADKLVAGLPLNKPSVEVSAELSALGDWHAANGRWADAAARFESVMKVNQLDPTDLISEDQLKLAATFLKSGNRQGYEQFLQMEIAKLSPINIASDYRTFKVGLVLPPDPNMLQSFVLGAELVEQRFPNAKELRPNARHAVQWSETLALLEYRQGHFMEAIGWCYRHGMDATDARTATTSLIKAMSGWRLAGYKEAAANWNQAFELIHAKSKEGLDIGSLPSTLFPGTTEDLEGSWYDWVIADLLMRECDELFAQSERTLDSVPKSNSPSNATIVDLVRALGEWHAVRGEWEQASSRFSQLPEDGGARDHFISAIIALKLGDEPGFLRVRDRTITRFNGTTEPWGYENVMQAGLLRPFDNTSVAALEPIVQFLERAVASAEPLKEGTYVPASWDLTLLGLFEYRRGNYAKALNNCQRSLVTCTYLAMPAATDRVIRALCFSRLGDDASARSELDGAKSLVQSGLNIGYDRWNWPAWAFVRLLLQETDSMIPQAPPPESPQVNH
ncbi:MAG TPA: serine/threonine-protein kinase [Candidatus Acidoferrum sp.]|jgi:serine/threonine protein kinase|nr:serine/threonine-protein kinase [Candidatus Acidoferrum sp.]